MRDTCSGGWGYLVSLVRFTDIDKIYTEILFVEQDIYEVMWIPHVPFVHSRMSEYTVYTYVYGELDKDDNIVYVGKSNDPKERNMNKKVDRFKILDKFIDIEQRWIHELSSSGVMLRNKEVIKTCGDFEVGKIYNTYTPKGELKPRVPYYIKKQIKHIPTQLIFETKYAASRHFGRYPSWCSYNVRHGSTDWEYV